jgi:hypothetical protein
MAMKKSQHAQKLSAMANYAATGSMRQNADQGKTDNLNCVV